MSENQKSEKQQAKKTLKQRSEAAQHKIVARMSDRQIERVMGSGLGSRILIKSMARMYQPSKAGNFRGEIEFNLRMPGCVRTWTIDCQDVSARATLGGARDPKVTINSDIAEFVKIGTGNSDLGEALMSKRFEVAGDIEAATRVTEMFGGRPLA